MLEYGETFLSENDVILATMYASMSPEAVELANFMAEEDAEQLQDA